MNGIATQIHCVWEIFLPNLGTLRWNGLVSRAQLSPIGLGLETIPQRRRMDQKRIGSGANSPTAERRGGAR